MGFRRTISPILVCALCAIGGAAETPPDAKHQADMARLAKQLDQGTAYQKSQAAQMLQREGAGAAGTADSVVATTVAAIDARDWWLAALGIDTISVIKPTALAGCLPSVDKALAASGDARREAARLAASLGPASAPLAPTLATLAGDRDCAVDALHALAGIGTSSSFVMPALRAAAQNKDAGIATAAIEGLERIGPTAKDAIPTLCAALARPDIGLRALSALSSFGHAAADVVPQVIDAEGKAPADQRAAFVRALQKIETSDGPPVAKDALAACHEGELIEFDLQVDDADDMPASLSVVFTGSAAHGQLKAAGGVHAMYRADWGFVGDEAVAWHANDRRADGKPAMLTITITPDTAPATPASVMLPPDQRENLNITFDKPLERTSAEKAENYAIDRDVKVISAALSDDGLSVVLRTSGLEIGATYALAIHGVADRAHTPVTTESDHIAFTASQYVPGLTGELFANIKLEGKPVETKNWPGIAAPGGPYPDRQDYSLRWTGFVEAMETATYTFSVTCDDGGRLWVDGKPLVDSWKGQGATEYTGTIELAAHSLHPITLEYFQGGGAQALTLAWSTPTMPKQPIPASALHTLPSAAPVPSTMLPTKIPAKTPAKKAK